jgi:GntR family transcriptional regulator
MKILGMLGKNAMVMSVQSKSRKLSIAAASSGKLERLPKMPPKRATKRKKTMHQSVASTLRERISYGIYPEDGMLPPELLLSAEFNVSRHTMREALKALVLEGLIERWPGRGTMISARSSLGEIWGIKSLEELIGEFVASNINVLYKGMVSAKQFPLAAEVFSMRKSGSLFQLRRVMGNNHGPAIVNTLFTLVKYAQRLPDDFVGDKPLIGLIEEYCCVQAARARQIATAIGADARSAQLLGVRVGAPLLLLRRIYLNSDDEPIEYTELICRPDRYHQSVDFLRGRKQK